MISRTITDHVYVTTSGFVTEPPFRLLMETFGPNRIMLSADYLSMLMDKTVAFFAGHDLSDADREAIAHATPTIC